MAQIFKRKSMFRQKLQRVPYAVWAVALLLITAGSALPPQKVKAYGLMEDRRIKISSSASGAVTTGPITGTNVVYEVGFNIATTGNVGSMIIDFCQNSPIIGDTCSTGTSNSFAINTNYSTLSINNQSGITDFSIETASGSTANTLLLSRPSAASVSASTAVSFTLGNGTTNGFTNPVDTDNVTGGNQLGTFYARLRTFASTDGTGTEIDAGGIALATTQLVTVTSKVTERLQFCVFTGASCAAGGGTVTLGDTNGVLDPAGPYVDKNTKYEILTNAIDGADVRIKGATLTSGSFTINRAGNPDGSNTATNAEASTAGAEQFGLCTYNDTTINNDATHVADDLYDGTQASAGTGCTSTTQTAGTGSPGGNGTAAFAFSDDATLGTSSTYGSIIAHKNPGTTSRGVVALIGNIALTTEAGIYTTVLNFIATGQY